MTRVNKRLNHFAAYFVLSLKDCFDNIWLALLTNNIYFIVVLILYPVFFVKDVLKVCFFVCSLFKYLFFISTWRRHCKTYKKLYILLFIILYILLYCTFVNSFLPCKITNPWGFVACLQILQVCNVRHQHHFCVS